MNQFIFANNVSTTLASGVSASATTLNLTSSANLPTLTAGQTLVITLTDSATRSVYEICYATAISGSSLTVTRGEEGTAATTWSAGDLVFSCATAGVNDYLNTNKPTSIPTLADALNVVCSTDGRPYYLLGRTGYLDGYQGQFVYRSGSYTAEVTADTAHAIYIPVNGDATGAGGVLQRSEIHPLKAEYFGAKFDNSTDDTAALQAWASFLNAYPGHATMPQGTALTTDTIQFGNGSSFETMVVEGAGGWYDLGTVIKCSSVDKPIIAVQGARGMRFQNFSVEGPNIAPGTMSATNLAVDIASWITPGLSTYQYSPQCGIAVDPFSGATPTNPYPGVTYGQSYSASVQFVNVTSWKNVVGFLTCVANGNGDSVTYDNCTVAQCAYAFANGNTQSRNYTIRECNLGTCHTIFDSLTFGGQQGVSPNIFGNEIGGAVVRVFNLNNNGSCKPIDGLYCEGVLSLGRLGNGNNANEGGFVLRNCDLNMNTSVKNLPLVLFSVSDTVFDGGELSIGQDIPINTAGSYQNVGHFRNMAIKNVGATKKYFIVGHCQDIPNCSSDLLVMNGSGGVDTGKNTTYRGFNITSSRIMPAFWTRFIDDGHTGFWKYSPGSLRGFYYAGGSLSAFSFNLTTDELTFTASTPEDFQVDDVLMWKLLADPLLTGVYTPYVPALAVTSISSGTITCSLLFDNTFYDTTDAPTGIRMVVPEWCPGSTIPTGDLTSGSATVSSVSDTSNLAVGDMLNSTVTGIATGTRIVSIGTGTITLNKNATSTVTGAQLYYGKITLL